MDTCRWMGCSLVWSWDVLNTQSVASCSMVTLWLSAPIPPIPYWTKNLNSSVYLQNNSSHCIIIVSFGCARVSIVYLCCFLGVPVLPRLRLNLGNQAAITTKVLVHIAWRFLWSVVEHVLGMPNRVFPRCKSPQNPLQSQWISCYWMRTVGRSLVRPG